MYEFHTFHTPAMSSSTTLSIRIPQETRRWLERFSLGRGSAGAAAARLVEEARRREVYRAIEFRDTPLGRVAWVQGTRIQAAFAWLAARDHGFDAGKVARHFAWPLWKAESVLAYADAYRSEIEEEAQALEGEDLPRRVPGLEAFDA